METCKMCKNHMTIGGVKSICIKKYRAARETIAHHRAVEEAYIDISVDHIKCDNWSV